MASYPQTHTKTRPLSPVCPGAPKRLSVPSMEPIVGSPGPSTPMRQNKLTCPDAPKRPVTLHHSVGFQVKAVPIDI